MTSTPSLSALCDLARDYRAARHDTEALVIYGKAIELYPAHREVSRELIEFLFELKKPDRANAAVRSHLARWPDDEVVLVRSVSHAARS
jgi:hypothetical protein